MEAGTGQSRIGEKLLEACLAEPVEAFGVVEVDLVTRLEGANRRRGSEPLVPGAYLVADITAKHPSVHSFCDLLGDRPAVLNGLVGDALGSVEESGFHKSMGWAGVEAASATTTVIRVERRVGDEVQVVDNTANYKP